MRARSFITGTTHAPALRREYEERQIPAMIDPVRVLLVDDNPDDRRWIARWLSEDRAFECAIDEADCFEDATRLLGSRAFDLGIVDWELPDGTGIELAQHANVIAQRLPLIFV